MILLKEVLGISGELRNHIRSYVKHFQEEMTSLIPKKSLWKKREGIPLAAFLEKVKLLNNQDLFRGEGRLVLPIKLVVEWDSNNMGSFITHGSWDYEIRINVARMVKANLGDGNEWYISEIDYHQLRSTLTHEVIHFLQRHTKVPHYKNPFTSKKSYMDRGYEQGAWAADDVELIRQELEPFANGENISRYILSALWHRGFSSENLRLLKQTNPKAWKRIMKRAVQLAMKDMDAKDKFPWQKTKSLPETARSSNS